MGRLRRVAGGLHEGRYLAPVSSQPCIGLVNNRQALAASLVLTDHGVPSQPLERQVALLAQPLPATSQGRQPVLPLGLWHLLVGQWVLRLLQLP